MAHPTLTLVRSTAGDRNDRGLAGATALAGELGRRLGTEPVAVGRPAPPLGGAWEAELAAARPGLEALAAHLDGVLAAGSAPVTAMSRCAHGIATLPVVARHRPDAVVLWFDAHADLQLPATTTTGYLGGLAFSGPLGLWDSGFGAGVAADRAVLVGARDVDPPEADLLAAGAVHHVPVEGAAAALGRLVAGRPVYVHLDCDVLEPGAVPTEYSVPGGLTLAALHQIATVLARGEVVGLEVGELEAGLDDAAAVAALADALGPLLDAVR